MVLYFGQKHISYPLPIVELSVFQQVGEHLEQVGFPRAKEARDPDAVVAFFLVVGFEKLIEFFRDFLGEYVLFHLLRNMREVISLDHAFEVAVDFLLVEGT